MFPACVIDWSIDNNIVRWGRSDIMRKNSSLRRLQQTTIFSDDHTFKRSCKPLSYGIYRYNTPISCPSRLRKIIPSHHRNPTPRHQHHISTLPTNKPSNTTHTIYLLPLTLSKTAPIQNHTTCHLHPNNTLLTPRSTPTMPLLTSHIPPLFSALPYIASFLLITTLAIIVRSPPPPFPFLSLPLPFPPIPSFPSFPPANSRKPKLTSTKDTSNPHPTLLHPTHPHSPTPLNSSYMHSPRFRRSHGRNAFYDSRDRYEAVYKKNLYC